MKNVNTTKKTDVKAVMSKIRVIGEPINKSDFWFYTEEITDEKGNPTVFHVQEGTGDNLLDEDIEEGFTDYIYYDIFDGEITYPMIDAYESGDDQDTLEEMESDGGMVLLYGGYVDLTVQQTCWKVLHMSGAEHPENLTVRILSGKQADEKFLSRGSKKNGGKNGPSSVHKLLVAIWVKNKGNYPQILRFLKMKTPISQEEIESLFNMEEEAVSKLGGRIVTIMDEDYPDSYKKMENPPFCYVEKGNLRFDAPIMPLKQK